MELYGAPVTGAHDVQSLSTRLDQFSSELPTKQLSKLVEHAYSEITQTVQNAKDAQIYGAVSPAVALVVTQDGYGSGSLLEVAGSIITNWHVVQGYEYVAVAFKPPIEGFELTRDEIKRAQVTKIDEVADLALLKASEVPIGRVPIRLGDSSEIAMGMDVHAIGHPTGEAWTYTTGVIAKYEQAHEWQAKGDPIRHKANVIQTRTPINPGSSGGALLSDSGDLIGINSFKADGEPSDFAVSVDELRRFINRSGNRIAQRSKLTKCARECAPKRLSEFRNTANDATVVSFDMFCNGNDTGELVIPDNKAQSIFLRVDRNGDGFADVKIFDQKRSGRWNLSLWDEKFNGRWSLVGYHDDGSLRPTRFESYAEFQRRTANR
jgi:Trypsin-like peptidase domain